MTEAGDTTIGRIAQSVERWSNKPLVKGSSPFVTMSFFFGGLFFLVYRGKQKKSFTSCEVRTHALKRGPELESGALTTRPQMLV